MIMNLNSGQKGSHMRKNKKASPEEAIVMLSHPLILDKAESLGEEAVLIE